MTAVHPPPSPAAEPTPAAPTAPPKPAPEFNATWRWLGLTVVAAVNLLLIQTFFNFSWMPSDEGHYVHVADRLANGEVLNRDIEELHPGYVHFIHAWAIQLLGREIVSLRYPVMALIGFQSILTYVMTRRAAISPITDRMDSGRAGGAASIVAATVSGIVMAGIGAFQISNPTPSLYCLAITVAIAWLAVASPVGRKLGPFSYEFSRAAGFGMLVGLLFLFRQLTAVFVVMGLLTFLFTEQRSRKPRTFPAGSRLISQGVLGIALLGLIGYLFLSSGVVGVIFFGIWPVAFLGWAASNSTASNREAATILSGLALGAAVSAIPLLAYHLRNDSLGVWANDTFIRSLSVGELEHIKTGSYLRHIMGPALGNLLGGPGPLEALNGIYWLVLPLLAFIAGAMAFSRAVTRPAGVPGGAALPIIAVFHGLVSVFNQVPYYLYLTAAFSLTAIIWMSWNSYRRHGGPQFAAVCAGALVLVGVAVWSQAGQPHTRTGEEIIRGDRATLVQSELEPFGILVGPTDDKLYTELVDVVQRHATATESIFVTPNSAEVYFLADRTNPFRITNPTLGILNAEELGDFVAEFDKAQPAVIVHNTTSVYNTERIDVLTERITADYTLVDTVEQFDVYVRTETGRSLRAGG